MAWKSIIHPQAKQSRLFWLGALLGLVLATTASASGVLGGSVHDLSARPATRGQSPTLVGSPANPGPGSLLCLSCHDGTLAVDLVVNRPLYGIGTTTTRHGAMTTAGTDSWLNCGTYCHASGGSWHDGTLKYLYTDLSNDHPVGLDYPSSPKLVTPPVGGKFANGVRLVNNRVECISCHNPHNPVIRPFLVTSDDNSALCYTCHVK